MRLSLPALDQSAAECDVERHQIVNLRAAQLDQRLFGREQIALGVEHFEIGRNALPIPLARKVGDLPRRERAALLRLDLLGEVAATGKRVGAPAERGLHRALLGRDRYILARLEIGSAPCRERGCEAVQILWVGVMIKK